MKPLNDELSQVEIINANKLIKRLRRNYMMTSLKYGRDHFYDPDPEYLTKLIMYSISQFNSVPPFTSYSLEDTEFLDQYQSLIISTAFVFELAHKRLNSNGKVGAKIDYKKLYAAPFPTLSQVMKAHKKLFFHSPFEWVDLIKRAKQEI